MIIAHKNRAGKTLTIIGVVGEFAKSVIPVLAGRWLGLSPATVAITGLAAVCVQMWPVFARFDGEKGNSIRIAMVMALAPRPHGGDKCADLRIPPALVRIRYATGISYCLLTIDCV